MILKNKVVVISGVGNRFGASSAHVFAREGAIVVLISRKEDLVKSLVRDIQNENGKAEQFVVDATNAAQVKETLDLIIEKYGAIDILLNNAGGSYTKRENLAEMDDEFWEATLRNNLKTTYNMSKQAIHHMKKTGGGSIINVSAAFRTLLDGNIAYATAKGGIIAFTKNLAREVRDYNVRVNCILPGVIRNDSNKIFLESQPKNIKRRGNSEDVAHAALFFASDKSSWITGQTLVIDGGEELHLPIE